MLSRPASFVFNFPPADTSDLAFGHPQRIQFGQFAPPAGHPVPFDLRYMRCSPADPRTEGMTAEEIQGRAMRVALCVVPLVTVAEEGNEAATKFLVFAEVVVR